MIALEGTPCTKLDGIRCISYDPPFADALAIPERGASWVEPQLVAQVGFTEWTSHGRLRHPRFLGLRDDKAASEVVRET
jgi:bifunctional non-homologous end joining protein LigD